jgi:leucyl/phenylalanyl-tRNA--protein transferase
MQLPWLDLDAPFPPSQRAWGPGSQAPGLLAAGGGLSLARLRQAYVRGIFPWYSPGQPVLWWSPDPRMVLPVSEFRLTRSLRKTIGRLCREGRLALRIDADFPRVIQACASAPREGQDGTWITPELIEAYVAWHRAGQAHSFEAWIDGELAGGLYGVGIGRMFFGESMFTRRTDASKIALAGLVAFCRRHDITLIDCQQHTGHLSSLGAREITRQAFERHVSAAVAEDGNLSWTYDPAFWNALGPASAPEAVKDMP